MTLTAQQLEARKHGLGGSDAGAVAGLSPWKSPVDVYLEKTGLAPSAEENEAMYWGSKLEDAVASAYAEREGHKIQRRNATLTHKSLPWMIANLDRIIVGDPRGPGVLEVKTAGRSDGWGEEGTDQVPDQYLCQVAHYLAVTGYAWARLAVLIGGRDFRVYDLPRDEELIESLIEIEGRFWRDHVEAEIPPDPRSIDDLRKLWPRDSGKTIQVTPEIEFEVNNLLAYRAEIKEKEARAEAAQKAVMAFMGDAATLTDPSGRPIVTWKANKVSRFDLKAFRAEHPEAAADYTNESIQRRFLLK